jgi:hypothetical protein
MYDNRTLISEVMFLINILKTELITIKADVMSFYFPSDLWPI